MANSASSTSGKQNLIQDVYVRPKAESRLLHTAIGALAEQWEKRKHASKKVIPRFAVPKAPAEYRQYTRIRPLATLDAPRGQYKIDSEVIPVRFDDLIIGLAGLWADIWRCLTNFQFAWLPKKYSTETGWHTDWSSGAFVWLKKVAAPIAGALLLILLGVWLWPLSNHANLHGVHSPRIGSNTSQSKGGNSDGNNKKPNSGGSTTVNGGAGNLTPAAVSPAATLNSGSPSTSSPGLTGVGGMGGGGATSSSGGSGWGTGGNLLNQSVTVPGTCLDASGKIIACTSPTTATLDPTL